MGTFDTHEEFLKKLPPHTYDFIETYANSRGKLLVQCRVCKTRASIHARALRRGRPCQHCKKQNQNKLLADHGTWIEVDVSTKTHPHSVLKIDKSDWETVLAHTSNRVFAYRMGPSGKSIYATVRLETQYKHTGIHNIIFPDAPIVDHKNHDGLDNRRKNLRPCTVFQNNQNRRLDKRNRAGITGICQDKKKWMAYINIKGKQVILGRFLTKEEAVAVRKQAEIEHYGEFRYMDLQAV